MSSGLYMPSPRYITIVNVIWCGPVGSICSQFASLLCPSIKKVVPPGTGSSSAATPPMVPAPTSWLGVAQEPPLVP
jgi:hypothetical protein